MENPICACGCGQLAHLDRRDKPNKYAKGHSKHWLKRQAGPPDCACGCGQKTKWRIDLGDWSSFTHGHHIRAPGANPNKDGHTPWNKGNRTRYKHTCRNCDREFENQFKAADFCDQKCLHAWHSGDRHYLWTGGKRTKYRYLRRNGKFVKAHRAKMSDILRRDLLPDEVVHHIDENGLNNDLSNLHLFHCDSCHRFHHNTKTPLVYFYPEVHT